MLTGFIIGTIGVSALSRIPAFSVRILSIVSPLKPSELLVLEQFAYYKLLSTDKKIAFARRVNWFIKRKQFHGVEIEISEEIKVLIAATATKISFGFGPILFKRFKQIVIYQEAYYSNITKNYHLGEVRPHSGVIKLSWPDFQHGYHDITDGRNLGVHELAHALKFENAINNGQSNFLNYRYLKLWNKIYATEAQLGISNQSVIRAYAYTNKFEFFASCLELFFELPEQLYAEKPHIYRCLRLLLKQDTILLYKGIRVK